MQSPQQMIIGLGLAEFYLDLFPILPSVMLAYVWIRSSRPENRKRVSLCAFLALVAGSLAPPSYLPNPPPAFSSEGAIWQWVWTRCIDITIVATIVASCAYLLFPHLSRIRRKEKRSWNEVT